MRVRLRGIRLVNQGLSFRSRIFPAFHVRLLGTCWERTDLLALVCGVQLWVCHFPIDILGQVWYLILSIPDLCTLTYFKPRLCSRMIFRGFRGLIMRTQMTLSSLTKRYMAFFKDHNNTYIKGYFHLCPRTDFLQTLLINNL